LKITRPASYAQPWGSPETGDVCYALKYNKWDNTQPRYRGMTIELQLINNSTTPMPDDWGGVAYVTGNGEQGLLCRHEYIGSGPPPGETRSVTFFAIVPLGDYVQYIRLNPLDGQSLELCLNRDGSACQ
jgi:hypothetical protein